MSGTRRQAMSGLAAVALAGPALAQSAAPRPVRGKAVQGGALVYRVAPKSLIIVDAEVVGRASDNGFFIVGFDRDARPEVPIFVQQPNQTGLSWTVRVAPGDFDIQRVDGLPQDTVSPQDPELLARIAAEAARKREGFASKADGDWFKDGFSMPLAATRVSGRFGGQRILNGTPSTPHYGADLAAPIGTSIHAPCDGIVSFAEAGLHYDGGLTMIDHGQGLITAYLHQSKILARKGDFVRRGQKIGEVGMEGRATGPHLCWRMKWRARNCDPTLLVA